MTFLGAMFAQPLPWPGKLRLAGEEATLRADELRSGIVGRAWLSVEARVRRAYYELLLAHELLELDRGPEPFLARDLGDRPRTLRRRYRRAAGRPAGASRGAAPRRGPGRPERPGGQSPRGAQSPARSTPGGADRDGPETGLPATGPGAARVASRDPPAKPRARRTLSRDRGRPVAGPADQEGVPAGLRRERRPDVPRRARAHVAGRPRNHASHPRRREAEAAPRRGRRGAPVGSEPLLLRDARARAGDQKALPEPRRGPSRGRALPGRSHSHGPALARVGDRELSHRADPVRHACSRRSTRFTPIGRSISRAWPTPRSGAWRSTRRISSKRRCRERPPAPPGPPRRRCPGPRRRRRCSPRE